jgi:hypothetical protein
MSPSIAVRTHSPTAPDVVSPLVGDQQAAPSRMGLMHSGKASFGMLKRMRCVRRVRPVLPPPSAFTGFRFPREVIVLAVRSDSALVSPLRTVVFALNSRGRCGKLGMSPTRTPMRDRAGNPDQTAGRS